MHPKDFTAFDFSEGFRLLRECGECRGVRALPGEGAVAGQRIR